MNSLIDFIWITALISLLVFGFVVVFKCIKKLFFNNPR